MKIEMTTDEFKKIFGDQRLSHDEFVDIAREKIGKRPRGRPKHEI